MQQFVCRPAALATLFKKGAKAMPYCHTPRPPLCLPPRTPPLPLVLGRGGPKFSYSSLENVETTFKIWYTFNLQLADIPLPHQNKCNAGKGNLA